ncbi:MAG: hypothetical protein HKN35_02870 [Woeseia sp.]|nr:hypothetical protein [Woeseia sp.]
MIDTTSRRNGLWGLSFILIFSVCLCWPMFVSGQLLTFYDTRSYLRGGEKIWDILFQLLSTSTAEQGTATGSEGVPTALTENEEGRNVSGRSFPYSAFAITAFKIGGPVGLALAQAAIATIMIAYLVTREARQSPLILAFGAVFVAGVTALPWYSTFLMPDIFGAFVVLFGIILVRDIDHFGFWATFLLLGIAGFSATAHYGFMPLMFGVVLVALVIRLIRSRLSWKSIIAGFVAVSFAPLINLGASSAVLKEPSMAPRRLPIILSRSISDGPALWYLQEVCPDAGYAMCDAYGDNLKANTNWFLWSDEGVLSLPKEQLDRIRDEEFAVVWGAFLTYPIEQTQSLFRHVYLQLFRVGLSEIQLSDAISDSYDPVPAESSYGESLRNQFDYVIPIATLASVVILIGAVVVFGITARWFDMLAVLALGYLGNAAVFGGLSAPIDRYQGRTAWLIPVLAFLFLAEAVTRRRHARRAVQTMHT